MADKLRVFMPCSGLGRVVRGFESFTDECFEVLSQDPSLDVYQFRGGGQSQKNSFRLWNLPRASLRAIVLAKVLRRLPYWVEQVTFAISLIPFIIFLRPDLIYFSDATLGNVLWWYRRISKQRFKLLMCNGGPLYGDLSRWDFTQQVAPLHGLQGLRDGVLPERQRILPYGVKIPRQFSALSKEDKDRIRSLVGIPVGRPVILSVGMIGVSHKRMDYVILEMKRLLEKWPSTMPKPYLLMLGQQREESPPVINLAHSMLCSEDYCIKTVPHDQIGAYYSVGDIFILASLWEGLARAFLEAMSWGLPCVAHDYEVTRYVLSDLCYLRDLTQPGALSETLLELLSSASSESSDRIAARKQSIYERFSWDVLAPQYSSLLHDVAQRSSGE